MELKTAVSVTAIIPVWNKRELLMKLLDTLDQQTSPVQEVLVIDNGSKDGADDLAEQRGARVIRLGRNMGFAYAVNRGALECHTEHLAILNSDVELEPTWLSVLLAVEAPFACGKILSAPNPEIVDGTFDLLCRGGCPWRAGHGRLDDDTQPDCAIDIASFTAILMNRKVFLSVGMLDVRFESYLEDVDFGIRCIAQDIQGRYIPGAVCRHQGSASLGRWHRESVRLMARNQLFLIRKYYPRSLLLRWSWPVLVAHTLWGLLALRHGVGLSWWIGKCQGIAQFSDLPHSPVLALEASVLRQEKRIHALQDKQGMDWYWRVYFALTGAKRHRSTDE